MPQIESDMRVRGAAYEIVASKLKILKKVAPALGYYAVMLAPIYGVGIGPFGEMTDFQTVTNRIGGEQANEYILTPKGYTPNARTLHEAKVYDIPVKDLDNVLTKVIERQPRMSYIASDPSTGRKEYGNHYLSLSILVSLNF